MKEYMNFKGIKTALNLKLGSSVLAARNYLFLRV